MCYCIMSESIKITPRRKNGITKRIEVSDLDDDVVEKVNGEHKSIHPLKKESPE